MKRRRLKIYLALLLASTLVRRLAPPPAPPPETRLVQLGAVRIAYRDSAPDSSGTPVVLIHGSPGSGHELDELAALLAPDFRVITPDLPGFGASTRAIPDYSFRAHARYLLQLLDRLGVARAHLAGFSMGGGVILSMYDLAPRHVASVAMLSAIGVQEHELLGSYRVNHALHGAQLAALWLLHHAVPHFGVLDNLPFSVEYARNFYDSDQRPLRGILERYSGPLLILHGSRDRLVPLAAAREHHRIAPRSELIVLDGDHFMAFRRPRLLAAPLRDFLLRAATESPGPRTPRTAPAKAPPGS